MAESEIVFRSSDIRLKEGKRVAIFLSWNARGAVSTLLKLTDGSVLQVEPVGKYSVAPCKTTTYSLRAQFADGSTQEKSLTIEVLPEASFNYSVQEHIDGDNVVAMVVWDIKNAEATMLNNQPIPASGWQRYLINWPKSFVFKYADPFGTYRKRVHVAIETKSAWLIWDIVKLFLRPFTTLGYAKKKEFWWTFLILFVSQVGVFLSRIIPYSDNLDNLELYNTIFFKWGYILVSAILYLMIMAGAKRRKDAGGSASAMLIHLPLAFYPILPFIIPITEESLSFYASSLSFFAIWLLVFFILLLGVGSQASSYTPQYKKLKVW